MLRTTKKMRKHQKSLRNPMNEPARVRWRGDFWDVDSYEVVGQHVEVEGKQCLRESVERDLVDDVPVEDDDGKVIGTQRVRLVTVKYKVGEIEFPNAYLWESHDMVVEPIDARRSGDGSDWTILIVGTVMTEEGTPLVDDNGQSYEVMTWVRESALTPLPNEDGEIDTVSFVPGHSRSVNAELKAIHTRKLVGYRALHRTDDSDTFGPKRPKVECREPSQGTPASARDWVEAERPSTGKEVDDLLVAEKREMDEETWRFWSEFMDRPQELAAVLDGREPDIQPTGPEREPSPHRGAWSFVWEEGCEEASEWEREMRALRPKRHPNRYRKG